MHITIYAHYDSHSDLFPCGNCCIWKYLVIYCFIYHVILDGDVYVYTIVYIEKGCCTYSIYPQLSLVPWKMLRIYY